MDEHHNNGDNTRHVGPGTAPPGIIFFFTRGYISYYIYYEKALKENVW